MLEHVLGNVSEPRPAPEVDELDDPAVALELVDRTQPGHRAVRLQRAEDEPTLSAADADGPAGESVEVIGEDHDHETTAA
jgi:hypothetical protein